MPRRVQDIVPNNHRSIREIPIERNTLTAPIEPPKKRTSHTIAIKKPEKRKEVVEQDEQTTDASVKRISVTPPRSKRSRGSRTWIIVLLAVVVSVAGVGYVASVYFSRASFTLVPRSIPVAVNSTYIAQNTPGKAALTYEIAAVKGSVSANVSATDGPAISTSAKGKVTLYNAYAAQPQRLIAGTRLSDESGRIYRIVSSISIPGYTMVNGSISPGTLVTSITADKPGQEYNLINANAVNTIKVVAYKGTPRYDSIYARLASDITGGYVGTKKTISPGVIASTTIELQTKLTASLLEQVKGSIPEGYIMYPSGYTTSFQAPTTGGVDPKSATLTLQGTLYGIIFKRDELVRRLAGDDAVAAFAEFAYTTPGLESLDFSIANQKDFSAEKKNTLIIKLRGDTLLLGTIPVKDLKSKLAGLSLADTAPVLKSFKPVIDIDKSAGQVTPPWAKVPSNIDHISIEVLTK